MIIGSYDPLEVGKIYNNYHLYDKDMISRKSTFQVLREATKQEYLDWLDNEEVELANHIGPDAKFYQISMD